MYNCTFFDINNITGFVFYLRPEWSKLVQQIRMSFSDYRKSKYIFDVRIGVSRIRVFITIMFCTFNEKHPLKMNEQTWVSLYFFQKQKEM